MSQKPQLSWTKPLLIDEGIRAVLCMIPMMVGLGLGKMSLISALGQAGFYYSYLVLPKRYSGRIRMSILLLTVGMGFYLIGGNVVFNPILATFFTFIVGMVLVFMSEWKLLGALALSFISIYSAGLNAGSPESVHSAFMAFVLSFIWAAAISMLPFWKGMPEPKTVTHPRVVQIEAALRMGFGTSIAFLVASLFGFAKLGWAPSGAGNVIRFDIKTDKVRARLRMIGTLAGCTLVIISLIITTNPTYLALMAIGFSFLNGLTKATKWGTMVVFYTVTILILYGLNDLSATPQLAMQRIGYNLAGVLIGVSFALYPFPRLFKKVRTMA